MSSILIDFFRWLPRYFFPKYCFGCQKEGFYVCPECRGEVKCLIKDPICPVCNKPAKNGSPHPGCKNRLSLDRLINFYEYDGWAKEIVKNAKFKKHKIYQALLELSGEFGIALKGLSSESEDSPYATDRVILTPVPLHWYRQLKRGYNQSYLIAKEIGKKLNIPVDEKILKRIRYTDPQTLVDKKLRRHNVSGAFSLISQGQSSESEDCPYNNHLVLLVDDVWTSGATMRECGRVLKRAGIKKVWGLTLLRA